MQSAPTADWRAAALPSSLKYRPFRQRKTVRRLPVRATGKMAALAEERCCRCTNLLPTCWRTVSGGKSVGSTAISRNITDNCTAAKRIWRRSGRLWRKRPIRRLRRVVTTTISTAMPAVLTTTTPPSVRPRLTLRRVSTLRSKSMSSLPQWFASSSLSLSLVERPSTKFNYMVVDESFLYSSINISFKSHLRAQGKKKNCCFTF